MTSRRRNWTTPVVGLLIGLVMAGVEIGRTGSIADGVWIVAIIGVYVGALVVLRARSETAGVLAGDVVDERWQLIHQRSLATTAQVVVVVLVGAFLVTEARGGDSTPYQWTAALSGAVYLGGILWYRWRM